MIEFRDHPTRQDGLALDSPDGAYVSKPVGNEWQITVVGPMRWTPGEYVDALMERFDEALMLEEVFFLEPVAVEGAADRPGFISKVEQTRRRGFVGMRVRKIERVPSDYVLVPSA